MLNDFAKQVHQTAIEHGWWDEDCNIPEKLCLIHSEVSEALESFRADHMKTTIHRDSCGNMKPSGFPSELADIVIRVCDLAAHLGIDIDAEPERKAAYNATRPFRHGGKRC